MEILPLSKFNTNHNTNPSEDDVWQEIESLDWLNAESEEKLGKHIATLYSEDDLIFMKNFCVKKRIELENIIQEKYIECDFNPQILAENCSYLVGLGKSIYEFAMRHPPILDEIRKENEKGMFEYVFDYAIQEKHNEN